MTDVTAGKHILIGGGSGFIGRALTAMLRARGDRVTLISRYQGEDRLTWDAVAANGIPDCDVAINLAGKHILDMRRPWTSAYRDEVVRSRVETTQILVEAINKKTNPPGLFISTAGKCFYGSQAFCRAEHYRDLDERSQPVGIDYPATLVRLWESAADEIDTDRVRHVKLRFGIVLAGEPTGVEQTNHPGGFSAHGIFPMLHAVFKLGLCLGMGTGAQPFPWVHIDDVVGIFEQAMEDPSMHGVFNVVSPGIISNEAFTASLAEKLGRPVLGAIPGWLIKAVVGVERSTILLLGQRVKPTRTVEHGYQFRFPDLDACLDDLLQSPDAGRFS